MAAGKGAKELIVEIVAVSEHHDGGICHRRMQDHPPRIEGHRQALARSLRVPHHTDPTIARFTTWLMARLVLPQGIGGSMLDRMSSSPQGFFDSHIHRMELMVARHLLDELSAALIFEHNEMS